MAPRTEEARVKVPMEEARVKVPMEGTREEAEETLLPGAPSALPLLFHIGQMGAASWQWGSVQP